MTDIKRYITNERIRASEVRVISETGENLGVLTKEAALAAARERELDLVVIAESTVPPVAKMLDFNKFLYGERKKASTSKAKSKKSALKELRLGPSTDIGDFMQRVERARKFIADGNKVRATVKLRGRQQEHPELGIEKLQKFMNELADVAKAENEIKRLGNLIIVTLTGK